MVSLHRRKLVYMGGLVSHLLKNLDYAQNAAGRRILSASLVSPTSRAATVQTVVGMRWKKISIPSVEGFLQFPP